LRARIEQGRCEALRSLELPQRALDRDLPDDRRAQQDLVGRIGELIRRGLAEALVIRQPP
jgi:hypothetical protein